MNKVFAGVNRLVPRVGKSGISADWTKNRDVLFPVIAILALGTFFVPLPPPAIDILVTLNLALTFVVVTRSLSISTPIQLTSYPTVLLITPVFRLCLSVSISRSI
ncbi:MAG TPA: FHIPEP family type III secretion protein, partial [Blastocatellia bacterium]|nr:FHIPEP family type III secretion protein [Blastocatellia bacterium]